MSMSPRIPIYSYQKWPWKSKFKVMVEVKVESYKVGVTSCRLTCLSFHVNWPSHSWDTAFSKFDLENPRSRSWVRWMLKATTWVQHSVDSHPFRSMSIGHPIGEIQLFSKFDFEDNRETLGTYVGSLEEKNRMPTMDGRCAPNIFRTKRTPA